MRKHLKFSLTFLLFIFLAVSACSRNDEGLRQRRSDGRTIKDATGRIVNIPREVERAVCVGAGALRYAVYAGGIDKIVGVEDGEGKCPPSKCFSYANREVFSKLPIIGRNGTPNEESILALNPDVIITTNPPSIASAMQKRMNIPVVCIPIPEGMFGDDVHTALTIVGETLGKQKSCKELSEYIKSLERDLKRRIANVKDSDRPTAYVGGISFKGAHGFEGTEGKYPPFEAVAVKNVVDELGRDGAFDVDIEQILKWDPQYIFLEINNMRLIHELYSKRPEIFKMLTAVRKNRVYSNVAFRFGATNTEMAIANAYYIGSIIYPEEFSDVDIASKTDEIFGHFLGVRLYGDLKKQGYEFKKIEF